MTAAPALPRGIGQARFPGHVKGLVTYDSVTLTDGPGLLVSTHRKSTDMSTDTSITAMRGLLDNVESDLKNRSEAMERLKLHNESLIERLRDAQHELALLVNNLADSEPRPAVEYLTIHRFMEIIHERNDNTAASLSKVLGGKAARIGRERGVLPIAVKAGSQSRHNAWPLHVWETAYEDWKQSLKF